MRTAIDFLNNNINWIFSGIGVAAISLIVSIVSGRVLNSKSQKHVDVNFIEKKNRDLSLESCLLLIYAANDNDYITRARALNGRIIVSTRKHSFMNDTSPKESAIWQDAIDILLENGLIRSEGKTNEFEIFGLTGEGYKKGENLKISMNVDTTKDPLIELKKDWT